MSSTDTTPRRRIDLDGVSRTDRLGLRSDYRLLLENGYDRETAREWVAERLAEGS